MPFKLPLHDLILRLLLFAHPFFRKGIPIYFYFFICGEKAHVNTTHSTHAKHSQQQQTSSEYKNMEMEYSKTPTHSVARLHPVDCCPSISVPFFVVVVLSDEKARHCCHTQKWRRRDAHFAHVCRSCFHVILILSWKRELTSWRSGAEVNSISSPSRPVHSVCVCVCVYTRR